MPGHLEESGGHHGGFEPTCGIRIQHPQSRACNTKNLAGESIHPTQLYSIAGNLVIGLALVRLWFLHAPLALIAGLYLLLTGLARFVEEACRGDDTGRTDGRG